MRVWIDGWPAWWLECSMMLRMECGVCGSESKRKRKTAVGAVKVKRNFLRHRNSIVASMSSEMCRKLFYISKCTTIIISYSGLY